MKHFVNTDVNFLGKRTRMSLNKVKNLVSAWDKEATRKGNTPLPSMTLNEVVACFKAGLGGLAFSALTPTGRQRNIMQLKWSNLA